MLWNIFACIIPRLWWYRYISSSGSMHPQWSWDSGQGPGQWVKCVACVNLPFTSETRERQRDSRDRGVGSSIYPLAPSLAGPSPLTADRLSLSCFPTLALDSHSPYAPSHTSGLYVQVLTVYSCWWLRETSSGSLTNQSHGEQIHLLKQESEDFLWSCGGFPVTAFSWKSTSKCYLRSRKQWISFLRLSPKVVNDHTVQLTPYQPAGEGQWDVKPMYMLPV